MRQLELGGAKIRVVLAQKNFETYKYLRSNQALHPVLSASVIVPALVDVIETIHRASVENSFSDMRPAAGTSSWRESCES